MIIIGVVLSSSYEVHIVMYAKNIYKSAYTKKLFLHISTIYINTTPNSKWAQKIFKSCLE